MTFWKIEGIEGNKKWVKILLLSYRSKYEWNLLKLSYVITAWIFFDVLLCPVFAKKSHPFWIFFAIIYFWKFFLFPLLTFIRVVKLARGFWLHHNYGNRNENWCGQKGVLQLVYYTTWKIEEATIISDTYCRIDYEFSANRIKRLLSIVGNIRKCFSISLSTPHHKWRWLTLTNQ